MKVSNIQHQKNDQRKADGHIDKEITDAMFAPRCTQYGTEGLTNHYENVMIFFSESVEGVLPCLLATSRLLPVSVARAFQ